MKPVYDNSYNWDMYDSAARIFEETPWVRVRDARAECFMATEPTTYTYGTPPHATTYTSVSFHPAVSWIRTVLNACHDAKYNVCFLNRYDNEQNQLGWHSDDSPGMDLDHPIAVVSFGEPREIWVREKGASGVVPTEDRYLLERGSLFVMPAGYQRTHQHRIPKGSRKMGARVSLTFRHYIP
jgi:alkylated DNA repair dioxygenase AlkB